MFSKEKINLRRQEELDIAKGLAILFMINIHVLWLFSSNEVYDTIFAGLVYVAGGPFAAPVFMFAMGIGVVYSRNNKYQYFLKRGLFLLILGYALNIFRFVIPLSLALKFNLLQAAEIEAPMYFSNFLIRTGNKTKLYLITAAISIIVFFIAPFFIENFNYLDIYNYYHHGLFENFLFASIVTLWISILYFINKLMPSFIINKLKFMSVNITKFYIIHWLIIGWSILLVGLNSLNLSLTIIYMLSLLIVSYGLTLLYNQKFNYQIIKNQIDIQK